MINMAASLKSSLNTLQLSKTMQSSGSPAFKSIGRQKKPSLLFRFPSSQNDLVYEVKDKLIRPRIGVKVNNYKIQLPNYQPPQPKHPVIEVANHPKTSQPNIKIRSISLEKYSNILKLSSFVPTPQDQQLTKQVGHQLPNTYGLSKCQFDNTIVGKLATKPYQHIIFSKHTARQPNINTVWYDRHNNIDLPVNNRQKLAKCHSFKSYLERKVFEPRKESDKFFDIEEGIKLTKPIIRKQLYDMKKPSARKDYQKKQGTQLSYNYQKVIKRVKSSTLSYKFSMSPRKLVFSKQVISNSRGCSR